MLGEQAWLQKKRRSGGIQVFSVDIDKSSKELYQLTRKRARFSIRNVVLAVEPVHRTTLPRSFKQVVSPISGCSCESPQS